MRKVGILVLMILLPLSPAVALTFDTLPSYQDEGMKLYTTGTRKIQEGDIIGAVEHLKKAVRLRPDLAEGFHNLGFAFEKTGDIPAAIAAYEKAVVLKPNYASALNNLGFLLATTEKDTIRAVRLCQQAIELEPNSANFRDSMGWACFKGGRIDEAVKHFQQAARLDPSFAKPRFNLGLCEFNRKNYAAAAREFSTAIQLDPGFLKAYIPLAVSFENLQMNNKALYVYQQALTKAPEGSGVRRHLDRQIKRLTDNSKSYYFSNVKQIQAGSKLAEFMKRKGKGSRMAQSRTSPSASLTAGNTTFTPLGNTGGGQVIIPPDSSVDLGMSLRPEPAIKTITSSVPRVHTPGSYQELSITQERELEKRYAVCHSYVERGLVSEAAAELERIIAAGGNSGIARQARNQLLRVRKLLDDRRGNQAEAHLAMGKDFFRAGKYDLAESEMNKAMSLDPANAEVHKDLALLHYNQGRLREAYEGSKKAIALDRTMKEAYIVLGSLYSKKGRIDDALRTLRKIRELPGGRDAVDELADRMINTLSAGT